MATPEKAIVTNPTAGTVQERQRAGLCGV